ncbi:hypothetical protein V6U71_21640 [Sphingopyxis sp. J-6]|uniref:hypothetical protein n=1 Tax=Sphingopyxis sp. J-6 TaxID=3122054 RepID=UPI0039844E59
MTVRAPFRVGHLDAFMVTTVARAEWYRRFEVREQAIARGETTRQAAAPDERLWDGILALAEETLVIAGHRRVAAIPITPEQAAAELRVVAERARKNWVNDGSPAGARRHDDLAELARLIADLPRRVALESERKSA